VNVSGNFRTCQMRPVASASSAVGLATINRRRASAWAAALA
jgi:hypothetical protein